MLSNRKLDGVVFNNEINEFYRKPRLIEGAEMFGPKKVADPIKKRQEIKSSLFESFILHKEVNFKVEGENAPLCFLINEIGLRGVEELIDDNAISFTLWNPFIWAVNHPFTGVLPASLGRFRGDPHSDPEQSIELSLKSDAMDASIKRREAKMLVRKLRDSYVAVPIGLEESCLDEAESALKSGKLKTVGLTLDGRDVNQLTNYEKDIFAKCASDLLDYKYAITKHAMASPTSNINFLFDDTLSKIKNMPKVNIMSSILRFENFPDLQSAFCLMGQPMDELLRIRKSRNAEKFREWISNINESTDPLDIQRMYVESNQNPNGIFDKFWGKSIKSATMMYLGYKLGSVIDPTINPAIGVIGGMLLKQYSLDMLDNYFLTELTKGWTPKLFINDLKSVQFKYST